jgi:SAM-dependent methyltransferase
VADEQSIPPGVSDDAAALLRRAYSLAGPEDSAVLYEDWAETYDLTMVDGLGYLSPRRLARMLAGEIPGRSGPVLDVGCGTGLAGVELANHGFRRLHGMDISVAMLRKAGRTSVYEALIRADLLGKLPIRTATYDAAICTGTFTHAHVGAACLDELFRILCPGALFACTIHRDVWSSLGFEATLGRLEASGLIGSVRISAGPYYASSTEAEGLFCLVRRTGLPFRGPTASPSDV